MHRLPSISTQIRARGRAGNGEVAVASVDAHAALLGIDLVLGRLTPVIILLIGLILITG